MALRAVSSAHNAAIAYGPGGASGVTPLNIAKSGIPFINISSGTMGNNGALSGVTALPLTYSNGAYIWLPAGAIAAGVPAAPAWYWCVFSSTTAGTVYNSTYTSGVPVVGTNTAFATTGPGAFTGDTSEAAGPTITIPAGSMGANGMLHAWAYSTQTNSAGTKTFRLRFSGAAGTVYYVSNLTTQLSLLMTAGILNRGTESAQIGYTTAGDSPTISFSTAGAVTSSVNTAAATTLVFSLQKGTATDNKILENFRVDLFYGA